MVSIAILATGDEIVQGDVLNTNTRYIAQALQADGFPVHIHAACCDEESAMLACFQWLTASHDVIITVGGLGPTTDDKTRFVLADFTQEPLIEHEKAMQHITARLQSLNLSMNAGNRQQALFPANTQLFPNPHGSAFGGCYTWNNKRYILLPGPPRECLPMFNEYVLPIFHALQPTHQVLLRWRLFGVAESVLDHMMEEALADMDCETGYRWDPPYVEFKVRCLPSMAETIQKRVDSLAKPHIIASVEEKASEKLRSLLENRQATVVINDKVTGGVLQTLIQRPANHAFLYFNQSDCKADWNIHIQGLDGYWTGEKQDKNTLSVTIQQQNGLMKETCELPWFGSNMLHYAAEWVSFKIVDMMSK